MSGWRYPVQNRILLDTAKELLIKLFEYRSLLFYISIDLSCEVLGVDLKSVLREINVKLCSPFCQIFPQKLILYIICNLLKLAYACLVFLGRAPTLARTAISLIVFAHKLALSVPSLPELVNLSLVFLSSTAPVPLNLNDYKQIDEAKRLKQYL
jgi:hypothetical protein